MKIFGILASCIAALELYGIIVEKAYHQTFLLVLTAILAVACFSTHKKESAEKDLYRKQR